MKITESGVRALISAAQARVEALQAAGPDSMISREAARQLQALVRMAERYASQDRLKLAQEKLRWADPALTGQPRPTIVTLCGSTRFYEAFVRANYDETMQGKIVLSVGLYMHTPETVHGESLGCTPEQKRELDQLHLRKVEMADEVLILNVGGYIGESTRRELDHALGLGKIVRYLENEKLKK